MTQEIFPLSFTRTTDRYTLVTVFWLAARTTVAIFRTPVVARHQFVTLIFAALHFLFLLWCRVPDVTLQVQLVQATVTLDFQQFLTWCTIPWMARFPTFMVAPFWATLRARYFTGCTIRACSFVIWGILNLMTLPFTCVVGAVEHTSTLPSTRVWPKVTAWPVWIFMLTKASCWYWHLTGRTRLLLDFNMRSNHWLPRSCSLLGVNNLYRNCIMTRHWANMSTLKLHSTYYTAGRTWSLVTLVLQLLWVVAYRRQLALFGALGRLSGPLSTTWDGDFAGSTSTRYSMCHCAWITWSLVTTTLTFVTATH